MQGIFLRKYGAEATIDLTLYKLDGSALEPAATFAAGDLKVMIDEGDEVDATNLPTDEGQTYSLVITAAQMTGKRIKFILVDQTSPQAWLDTTIIIETYGHASAQHPFELDGTLAATIASIKGSGTPDVAAVITAIAALNDLSDADVRADVLAAVIHGTATLQALMQSIGDGLVTPPTGW